MTTEKKSLADPKIAAQQRNKAAIIGAIMLNLSIAVAYYIEVLKQARTIESYTIVFLGSIVPMILLCIVYFKKKEAISIRYIITIAFCLLYSYIMFTTTKNLAFCYILLLLTLLTVYADIKLSLTCAIYAIVINIAVIIKKASTVGLTENQITETEIILACLLLAGIFLIMVTIVTSKINYVSLEESNKEKEKLSSLLNTILKVSEIIIEDADLVRKEMQKLGEKIVETENSMETLSHGAKEMTSAIYVQQENTQEINYDIIKVEAVTKEIAQETSEAEAILKEGQDVMDSLLHQVTFSENSSNQVAKEMGELQSYTDKMQGIMTLINNVASKTGLLALNASIEAARAGAAGKGFAVVAGEISNLASQTRNATGDINHLIASIAKSLQEVVKAVDNLLESNQKQNGYVNDTAANLGKIHKTADNIMKCAEELSQVVQLVAKANITITESIQNVSAVTEHVSKSAEVTLVSSKENKVSVKKVSSIIEELNEKAHELNKN